MRISGNEHDRGNPFLKDIYAGNCRAVILLDGKMVEDYVIMADEEKGIVEVAMEAEPGSHHVTPNGWKFVRYLTGDVKIMIVSAVQN